MDVCRRFVRNTRTRFREIVNWPFDFSLEFKILKFALKHLDFDPFGSDLLKTTSSKCKVAFVLTFLSFAAVITVRNAFVDFVGDADKQASAVTLFFGLMQCIFKMASLLMNRSKVSDIRKQMLQKDDEDIEIELKYRKVIRFAVAFFWPYTMLSITAVLLYPLFAAVKFSMPIYTQLPWTDLKSHPSFDINYVYLSYTLAVTGSLIGACDSFFIMMAIQSIAKLEVCCHYAEKLGTTGHDSSQSIEKFVERHLKALELIRATNSVYQVANLGQLLTTLGLFVVVAFQARNGLEYSVVIMFGFIMLQLFLYCLLSELVITKCNKLQFALYSSNWYEVEDISFRKKILFMMTVLQKEESFSACGFAIMSLETYASIINCGYSYLTCLLNVV